MKHRTHVTIPPGQTIEYPCELTVLNPDPFAAGITLFLEDHGIRKVMLTVCGVGVAPETRHDKL